MEVLIKFNQGFTMKSGWNKFTKKYNLQVGDACKFVMTQSQPLSFSVTITRVRKKTNPSMFLVFFSFLFLFIFYILLVKIFLN